MELSPRMCLLGICLLLSIVAGAFGQQKPTYPRVTIAGSEVRTLKSTATGRDYDLYVHLPSDHGTHKDKKYPVLYVLDGQWDFKLLDSVLGGLVYDKFVPEMIVVAVTYSGANPNYDALRAMDYTPTPVATVAGSGGGPKFLAFFKKELIPFVESNYQADASHRILLGSSYGGLFTLYAMFAEPGLFGAYIAASPAVSYDGKFSFKQESEFAAAHHDLPVRLFISVGDIEGLTQPVKEFMQVIKNRGYKGLKLEARLIEGERHAGNKPEAYNRGLRFTFRGE